MGPVRDHHMQDFKDSHGVLRYSGNLKGCDTVFTGRIVTPTILFITAEPTR
jgi:hypothetical protein